MLFKWSSGGYDVSFLDMSIRSLHRFYPDAYYIVCYNGPKDKVNHFKEAIGHLPVRIICSWDYPWLFKTHTSQTWYKYVPLYLDEYGGTQLHIDNDIIFIRKPSRFSDFCSGVYLTPEREANTYNCSHMLPRILGRGFRAVNTGIIGLDCRSQKIIADGFFDYVAQLQQEGIDLNCGAVEQSAFGWFVQDHKHLDLHFEDSFYIASVLEMQYSVYELSNFEWVAIHFLATGKNLFSKFYGFFQKHYLDWNDTSLEILQSLLKTEDLGNGTLPPTRKDRLLSQVALDI